MADTLATFLSNIGTFYTEALGWVGETMTVVTENPALMVMCIAIPIAGVAIGFLGRLFRVN